MQFSNEDRGECRLLKCDQDKYLIQILTEGITLPYVVTNHILKNGTWLHAEYFKTYEDAKKAYLLLQGSESHR